MCCKKNRTGQKMRYRSGLYCFVIVFTTLAAGREAPLVRRLEYLQYAPVRVPLPEPDAERTERAAASVSVSFTALGREFRLVLAADRSTFSLDLVVRGPAGPPPVASLYQGRVQGHPSSFVYGSLYDGVFEGTIEIPPDSYYVEPAEVYRSRNDTSGAPTGGHSVIYSSRDVHVPNGPGCGFKDGHTDVEKQPEDSIHDGETAIAAKEARPRRFISGRTGDPPSANPNRGQAGVCIMSIETDPTLWKYVIDMFEGDARRSRNYIISLIGNHMVFVNRLYAEESFHGVYPHEGLQFRLQKLLITDGSSCEPGFKGEPSRFCATNVDYKDYLNLQSMGDHQEFCLGFVFAYRDFTESVMGFAWKGSSNVEDKYSGVCGKIGVKMMMKDGKMQKVRLSKNCGIVTLLNHNSRVPPITSHITLAHEIGHTLGSPHDLPENNKPECVPGGYGGNYIMYPYSVDGYDPNNSHFSPCSKRHISRVLDIIANGKRRQCFLSAAPSYCGNQVLEPGEECDCGYSADSCLDPCCYPRVLSDADRDANRSAVGCTRRAKTQCSASEGPCCQPDTCRLVPASVAHTCQEATDCLQRATCNGSSAACPKPAAKPNMTDCQRGSRVCLAGLCQGSACLKRGLADCALTANDTDDRSELCLVTCWRPDAVPQTCEPLRPGPISRMPGTTCDNATGYCDEFGFCRPYREDGPLARVRRLLFTGEGHTDILSWLQYKWWAALLILVLVVLLMAVTVRCFAVHTPSSNPLRPPARPLRETVRHPVAALGLPRRDQVKCWPGARPPPGTATAADTPSAPPAPPASDADAWSETSSFEHQGQRDFPALPPDGSAAAPAEPAPLASVAI